MDIRSSDINDTTEIYDLQIKCFEHFDIMYKHNIEMLAATGIVAIENNKIIGFLLQTQMFACSELSSNTGMETSYLSNSSFFEIESMNNGASSLISIFNDEPTQIQYDIDKFIPINERGIKFKKENQHIKNIFGIVLIGVDPDHRNKGVATMMINKHIADKKCIQSCLHARKYNPARKLYEKLGYIHIANIIDKYYGPTEDCCFYIHE